MSDVKPLHDEDFVAWSKEQAEALRAAARTGSNLAQDWANLAEEIEDLGVSQNSALHS
jgi:predicted YcjX-like family ATPase